MDIVRTYVRGPLYVLSKYSNRPQINTEVDRITSSVVSERMYRVRLLM